MSDNDCGADRLCAHKIADGENDGIDPKGIQRYILKYENHSISQYKISDFLFQRRINKLKNTNYCISFKDFQKLFLEKGKTLLVSQATPGIQSRWNQNIRAKSDTKTFKKDFVNRDEVNYAFKKYFIG